MYTFLNESNFIVASNKRSLQWHLNNTEKVIDIVSAQRLEIDEKIVLILTEETEWGLWTLPPFCSNHSTNKRSLWRPSVGELDKYTPKSAEAILL